MAIRARRSELSEIAALRELYRQETKCQIIHDSIHGRAGWTLEFALEGDARELVGYGSVAVAGPWKEKPALYEFFLSQEHRRRTFEAFAALLEVCGAAIIETQSNEVLLPVMLYAFARNVAAEAILFEDQFETTLRPEGAGFRAATPADERVLLRFELDDKASWVATWNGEVVGAGDILYHYNRPYGDVYMKIAEPFRRKGLGAYLVQELKAVCRAGGSVPAARCNVGNVPSRRTLQRAGFVPCGALLTGELGEATARIG